MGLVLDSSVLIAAERGRLDVDRHIQGREEELDKRHFGKIEGLEIEIWRTEG